MTEKVSFKLSCTFDSKRCDYSCSKPIAARAYHVIEKLLKNSASILSSEDIPIESFDLSLEDSIGIVMEQVKSSNVSHIGYSAKEAILQVEFIGGSRYRYSDVPAEVFEEFRSAESAGKYFHKKIKGRYSHWSEP